MKKKTMYSEMAYILGVFILALGTAWMERGGLGLSMVVAPAYILHLKVSQILPFFSFGMAEYSLQLVLLLGLSLWMKKGKAAYLFSFATAVIYGLLLDLCVWLTGLIPVGESIWVRLAFYGVGLPVTSLGVALLFHTYLPPAAYELTVKEISQTKQLPINKVKTTYDCISCAVAVVMSFLFFGFGHFVGVSLGTVFCALVNGWIIGLWTKFLDRCFDFEDKLNLRNFFS